MTRSGLRRERAIIAVLRTGHIPGQNVTQLEFCDLVRTAARIRETPEGFPRGLEQGIHHELSEQDYGQSRHAL
jgi:hypothetical protein